ncbi:MAG: hypothetical protein M1820_002344 [Bogoriella megaspora]|nr:MAG: hypothetical protein M1820_002344 [Bogoriella megaspora]
MLARKLLRARKLRRLDPSRDTKSLQLYHHILWLSREGLSIVELHVLPYAQNGEFGAECRVMSSKLRASFYHVFCLFHNNPPISTLSVPSQVSLPPDIGVALSPGQNNGRTRRSPNGKNGSRHVKQASLRDTIPSLQSDISYITNPYALTGQTPPPAAQSFTGQTPSRPPGLPMKPSIPSSTAFLLPPLNFLPITTSAFTTTSSLASSLLPGSHPLRLSVALEHSAFLYDCAKEFDRARRIARRAVAEVYNAQEDMDDTEYEDARELVSLLGSMMMRGLPREAQSNIGVAQNPKNTGAGGGSARPGAGAAAIQSGRSGNEGAWIASSSSRASPGRTVQQSRRSPPSRHPSRASPPRRQGSTGTGSTTPKPARSAVAAQQAKRSPPRRQDSYGTGSSTPRPSTAIRDSPRSQRTPASQRTPVSQHTPVSRDKDLPPTPQEWTARASDGNILETSTEATPHSGHHNSGNAGSDGHAAQDVTFQTPARSTGGASGASGSRSGGSSHSTTRGGSSSQRGSVRSASGEESDSQAASRQSGGKRTSGIPRPTKGTGRAKG